ncbi:MAG: efflux RND transporter permease subunit [Thermoanaerobacterales bacterium]|nr:efflux RND transporter permease subunit [Thermoanaerobacterales bacterium]
MKIAHWSVRRPVTVMMVMLAIIILGLVSFGRLAIDLLPRMNLPYAVVVTSYPGAGPQEVEQMVSKPLEQAVGSVENVKDILSTSQAGSSMVMVGFDWGTDMNFATLQMREKIDLYKGLLPKDVESPMVMKADVSMMPAVIYGVTGDQDLATLKRTLDEVVKPRLERLEGVASVSIQGGEEREIQVLVDPAKLYGYGLSLSQVTQALGMSNLNQSGGTVQEGSKDFLIRVPGEFRDLKDIQDTVINTPTGAAVRLMDVAEVRDGIKDQTTVSRLNGKPSLAIVVSKQPTANTVSVVREVRKAVAELEKSVPGGLSFIPAFDQAEFIESSINGLVRDVFAGGFLAVLAIFLFLRNIRTTLIIATSIPVAVIGAFTLVYFTGGTLNMLTLGGLALGIGMIVDDAIVVLENIYRRRQGGRDLIDAATFGADEVGGAVLGATTTGIAVFVPVIFVQGLTSELFGPLALTVSFALVASYLVAMTLIPVLSSRLLYLDGKGEPRGIVRRALKGFGSRLDGLNARYGRLLDWGLKRRRRVVGIAAALFFGSLFLVPVVGTEFMPKMDEGIVSITIRMPRGSSLEATDRVVTRVEEMARAVPEIETAMVTLGVGSQEERSGFGGGSTDRAMIDLMLKDKSERQRSAEQVADQFRRELARFPGIEYNVTSESGMFSTGGGGGLQIKLKGDDLAALERLADQAVALLKQVPGTREVESSLAEGRPEVEIVVDRDRAGAHGLSVAHIASAVRTSVQGEVATLYRVGGDEIDVRVRLAGDAREDVADLEDLLITAPSGEQVPLRDVAELRVGEGPTTISRENQARVVTISGKLVGRDLGSVIKDAQARLAGLPLPPGYTIEYGGEAEEMAETFGNLSIALILAVVLVYMVLAVQFESLVSPLAIMFSVPVSLTGVVLGLLLTGKHFSVPAFIGAIVCVGVVVKNAIVLVDYINILRARGMEREEAIRTAGPIRLRPILMTAFATVFAMLPLALGLGEGGEMHSPLAVVVIGGLIFSTLVSLLLVPVMYSILDDFGRWAMRRLGLSRPPEETVLS